jgi:hypothetical protein
VNGEVHRYLGNPCALFRGHGSNPQASQRRRPLIFHHIAEFISISGFLCLLEVWTFKTITRELNLLLFGLVGGSFHGDGGPISAVAVGESIAMQGDTWDELCFMVLDGVKAYYHDSERPVRVRLFLQAEQVLALA